MGRERGGKSLIGKSLVGRIVLEPSIERRSQADAIADRLSRFARHRLPVVIDEAMRGLTDDLREHVVERLELDLGGVPDDELEARIEDRLLRQLRAALIDHLGVPGTAYRAETVGGSAQSAESARSARSADSADSAFANAPIGRDANAVAAASGPESVQGQGGNSSAALDVALEAGPASARPLRGAAELAERARKRIEAGGIALASLVQWFEGRPVDAQTLNQSFAQALAARPSDVALLLREHGRHTARRERWVRALAPALRPPAVSALRPSDAPVVLGDIENLRARQDRVRIVPMTEDAFDDALWQTVFAYLLADRGSRFNRRAFLRALIAQLAARTGIAFAQLIDTMLARMGESVPPIVYDEPLIAILTDLRNDAERDQTPVRAVGERSARIADRGRSDAPAETDSVDGGSSGSSNDSQNGKGPGNVGRHVASARANGGHAARDGARSDETPASSLAARDRDLQLLDFFLDYGAWPWLAPRGIDPSALVLKLARTAPLHLVLHLRSMGRDSAVSAMRLVRLSRLADLLDASQRAQFIERIEPAASRRIVSALGALERLLDETGEIGEIGARRLSFAERAALRRAFSTATFEALVAERAEAFNVDVWFAHMLARAAKSVRISTHALTDTLIFATHGDAAHTRRMRLIRARLIEGVSLSQRGTNPASRPVPAHAKPMLDAFVAAWPRLVRRLSLTPTSIDRALVDAVSQASEGRPGSLASLTGNAERGYDEDGLLAVLHGLSMYHGVAMGRWLAALASDQAWRDADRGLAYLRRWRAAISLTIPTATDLQPAGRTAMAATAKATATEAFTQFFARGRSDRGTSTWLAEPVDAWLDASLHEAPSRIAAALRARSPDEPMIERLDRFLRPSALARLTAAIEPELASIAEAFLQSSEAFGAARQRPAFAAALRRAVLAALMGPAPGRASPQAFVSRILDGLAKRINVPHANVADLADSLMTVVSGGDPVLLDALHTHAQQHDEPGQTRAGAVGDDMDAAAARGPRGGMRRAQGAPVSGDADAFAVVAAFFRYGERSQQGSRYSLREAMAALLRAAPRVLRRTIARAAVHEPACTRLASLGSDTFDIAASAWLPDFSPVASALRSVAIDFHATGDRATAMRRAHRAWLRHAPRSAPRAMLAELVEETLSTVRDVRDAREARAVLARWRRAVRAGRSGAKWSREWLAWLQAREALVDSLHRAVPEKLNPSAPRTANREASSAVLDRQRPVKALRTESVEAGERAVPPGDDERSEHVVPEPIHVANGGLVLLWPFLPRYFELLDLMRKGDFVDFSSRSRAVQLLHLLASGRLAHHEAELPLAKVLCGVAPAMPLAVGSNVEPDARERTLSEELLGGVRQNWDKLRNTTADALRETFLMRDGRLQAEGGLERSWRLIVELKAYDVLLDTLPWRLSPIRFGWMTEMLSVQWRR